MGVGGGWGVGGGGRHMGRGGDTCRTSTKQTKTSGPAITNWNNHFAVVVVNHLKYKSPFISMPSEVQDAHINAANLR